MFPEEQSYNFGMGRGNGNTTLIPHRTRKPQAQILEEGLEIVSKIMGFCPQRRQRIARFILSPNFPHQLRHITVEKARFIVEHNDAWVEGRLSSMEESQCINNMHSFYELGAPEALEILETAASVTLAQRRKILLLTKKIAQELITADLLPDNFIPLVIPINYSTRLQTGQQQVLYGMNLPLARATLISVLPIGNDLLLRKVITHELIHANEAVRDADAEYELHITAFPAITAQHSRFVTEGIVDYLANEFVMGDPHKNPDDLGQEGWYNINTYQQNTFFVQQEIVPHLLATLKKEETLRSRLASLLRSTPGNTFLTTIFKEIPGLQAKVENLSIIP